MKKLIVGFCTACTLFILTIANSSNHVYKNIAAIKDTLPRTDTMHGAIDTFGGIKNMNDSNLKPKRDSSALPPHNNHQARVIIN